MLKTQNSELAQFLSVFPGEKREQFFRDLKMVKIFPRWKKWKAQLSQFESENWKFRKLANFTPGLRFQGKRFPVVFTGREPKRFSS